MMKVKFWGVRGSIPCPGPQTMKYGGNGACIELRVDDREEIIIIDAGSGIRELGNALVKNDLPAGPLKIAMYLSHTHWDHIMGFPYFTPIYIPGTRMTVHGPVTYEDDPLKDVVGGQMKYRYFPINVGELASDIEYKRLREEPDMDLGNGLLLTTKFLNHPITALGYRFEYQGKIFCTCYDHEPYRNLFITDPEHPEYDEAMAYEGEEVAREQNQAVEEFFKGADLLVHDSQYTAEEYKTRVNWGHSTFEWAIAAANRAGVKKLALFHHDPDRTDAQIENMAKTYCEPKKYGDTEVFFATERAEIIL
ncbi:metal-dependent hydrolase, beta-lactamase superfamily I [Desulfocapsa sulfexigens DSM 10523]|uniref:Metal-dependent hydrolase, beta-lactamase superfamily I n=1 Tax=Desulfocapsa sulfexigens (strain DSM 10523 / SB164P1) TaxID=1167006 RepID=M1PK42_DESSD|nr:MBL fold metallo-hydrolase [Desulfocapsa sulfexigens]AGF76876.1 metal-dependent hydrolase, beta-lactamase superfamily I [Desulfocapsa sulfexigens DSM 10523]